MKKTDQNGKPVNLIELLAAHPEWRSPLGGFQGKSGFLFGVGEYAPNSMWDKLLEAFAGTHDTLNSKIWYGPDGNIKQGMTQQEQTLGEIANGLNILPATPFALSVLLPAEVWTAIAIGLKGIK